MKIFQYAGSPCCGRACRPMKKLVMTAALGAAIFTALPAMAQPIEFVINGKTYAAELSEAEISKNFAARLPITVTFENFGSHERIAYLNPKLRIGNSATSCTPEAGDITYYIPWGNLAVFTHGFRYSENLAPMGKISPEGLAALRASGDKPVTIRRAVPNA